VIKKLEPIQSSGLRVIAGAFRATLIQELESETFITPLNIYYSELRARHLRRTYSSLVRTFIKEQYRAVRRRLLRRSITRTSILLVVPVTIKSNNGQMNGQGRFALRIDYSKLRRKERKEGEEF
jgi:hypothetical protein